MRCLYLKKPSSKLWKNSNDLSFNTICHIQTVFVISHGGGVPVNERNGTVAATAGWQPPMPVQPKPTTCQNSNIASTSFLHFTPRVRRQTYQHCTTCDNPWKLPCSILVHMLKSMRRKSMTKPGRDKNQSSRTTNST